MAQILMLSDVRMSNSLSEPAPDHTQYKLRSEKGATGRATNRTETTMSEAVLRKIMLIADIG